MTYHRLPDRSMDFPAVMLHEDDEGIVVANLLRPLQPLILDGTLLLDANYLGIWFCCLNAWHDVGAVYDHQQPVNLILTINVERSSKNSCSPMKGSGWLS